jgi:hypothetical protein
MRFLASRSFEMQINYQSKLSPHMSPCRKFSLVTTPIRTIDSNSPSTPLGSTGCHGRPWALLFCSICSGQGRHRQTKRP